MDVCIVGLMIPELARFVLASLNRMTKRFSFVDDKSGDDFAANSR
jgi:hypothetical protein